tara:strand:+ start:950 stop:1102 length:153 start_codon:yes stop_codon:yes gene_type:complete
MFETLGYGTLEQDFGYKCIVKWLLKGNETLMHKKFLYIMDETEKDGYKEM